MRIQKYWIWNKKCWEYLQQVVKICPDWSPLAILLSRYGNVIVQMFYSILNQTCKRKTVESVNLKSSDKSSIINKCQRTVSSSRFLPALCFIVRIDIYYNHPGIRRMSKVISKVVGNDIILLTLRERKIPLVPLGVLAQSLAHTWPSAWPPIDTSGIFSAHVSKGGG